MNENEFGGLYRLLAKNKLKELRDELSDMAYPDIAEFIMDMDDDKLAVKIFRILPKDISADVFSYLETDSQTIIVQSITDSEIERLMDDLYVDDAVDFLEEVPANIVRRVLANTDKETRDIINRFLKYPEGCAGSVMTIEMVELHDRSTVAEAIKSIRRSGVDKETIYTCYVIDDKRHLVGTIPLRRLLLNEEDTPLTDIMSDDEQLIYVKTMDDQEEVAAAAKKYDLLSVPVVDNEGRLVGIITIDDIVDIIDEEATEDMEKMAAIVPGDKPYIRTSVWENFLKRIPWLLFLMVSSAFTGAILESYKNALSVCASLNFFIPMLMGTGGNAGGQASVTVIRGLSMGEIEYRDVPSVMWKEIRVALLCGLCLAIANFGKLMLFDKLGLLVALTVSLTLVVVVLMAMLLGCVLPVIAKRIGLDPAVMASPFITTIVDALSLLVYFRVAVLILGISV